jgi:hypothetical protein
MRKLSRLLSLSFPVALACASAQAQLRIVNYNMLDKPTSTTNADVVTVFNAIATDTVNGIARKPDLIVLQEMTATSTQNLATILNTTFGGTDYVAILPGGQPNTDRQGMVYNQATLSLIGSVTTIAGAPRPALRGQFRPVGYSSADAILTVYGMHLAASDATTPTTPAGSRIEE